MSKFTHHKGCLRNICPTDLIMLHLFAELPLYRLK